MTTRLTFAALVLVFASTATTAAVAGTPANPSRTVTVELTDTTGTKVERRAFTVRLARTDQLATVKVNTRTGSLKMSVRVRRETGNMATVSLGLERSKRRKGEHDHVVLNLDSRVALGKRANVATIPRGGSSSLGVALTVR